MAIIKQFDKRSGITYVYDSKSYYDKEKKCSRAKRVLIGKLNPETGEIIPTDGRNKGAKSNNKSSSAIIDKDKRIQELVNGHPKQEPQLKPPVTDNQGHHKNNRHIYHTQKEFQCNDARQMLMQQLLMSRDNAFKASH